jgi:mRNA interferase MazF
MTTNPIPVRGEVWRIRFDPAEGDEIKKVRTAVVISEDAIGRLKLKIVVPITEWKAQYAAYPWFVYLAPTPTNGLTKDSGADTFQVKSVSEGRFLNRLGALTPGHWRLRRHSLTRGNLVET